MATFTPFMQGSEAQSVISDYLGGKLNSTPNVNSAGKFRNPLYDLRTVQEGLGELDPSADFPNPILDFSVPDTPVDPCPVGFMLVDGVCQPVEQFGQSVYQEDDDDNDAVVDTRTESEKMYDEMKKDTSLPFGANREIDKYSVGFDKDGNEIFEYKKKPFMPTLGGIFDAITGGNARRENRYNDAMSTILGQTQSDFYPNANPFAFGNQMGNQFTKFSNQNYLDRVQDEIVKGSNQGATMGDLLGSVGQGTAPINQGGQGTQTSDNSNYMMQDNGRRDDTAYEAAIAKNIARNLSNRDSTTGQKKSTASTGSGFSKSLGGFYKGR
jgi:hypothetical protein